MENKLESFNLVKNKVINSLLLHFEDIDDLGHEADVGLLYIDGHVNCRKISLSDDPTIIYDVVSNIPPWKLNNVFLGIVGGMVWGKCGISVHIF